MAFWCGWALPSKQFQSPVLLAYLGLRRGFPVQCLFIHQLTWNHKAIRVSNYDIGWNFVSVKSMEKLPKHSFLRNMTVNRVLKGFPVIAELFCIRLAHFSNMQCFLNCFTTTNPKCADYIVLHPCKHVNWLSRCHSTWTLRLGTYSWGG